MKILLLGATGYLGANIAHKLYGEGHVLTCVVRSGSDISRIENLDINYLEDSFDDIELYIKEFRPDWIINSAGLYKVNSSLYDDLLTANLFFPLKVLNYGLKYGVNNFLNTGTSLPVNLNFYSFSKLKFSEFGKYICEQEKLNFADLKIEMFYGGLFEPEDRFIASCKKRMIRDEAIPLTSGTQKRDLVRVEDVVGVIARIIDSNYVSGYRDLSVGTGENHTIIEIVEYMKRTLNSNSRLEFGKIQSREGEPDTLADIRWYMDIGYELEYSFFGGLKTECISC